MKEISTVEKCFTAEETSLMLKILIGQLEKAESELQDSDDETYDFGRVDLNRELVKKIYRHMPYFFELDNLVDMVLTVRTSVDR